MPIKADILMSKYKIPEGKILGNKLKLIEDIWVKNNFKISDNEVDNIINNYMSNINDEYINDFKLEDINICKNCACEIDICNLFCSPRLKL